MDYSQKILEAYEIGGAKATADLVMSIVLNRSRAPMLGWQDILGAHKIYFTRAFKVVQSSNALQLSIEAYGKNIIPLCREIISLSTDLTKAKLESSCETTTCLIRTAEHNIDNCVGEIRHKLDRVDLSVVEQHPLIMCSVGSMIDSIDSAGVEGTNISKLKRLLMIAKLSKE